LRSRCTEYDCTQLLQSHAVRAFNVLAMPNELHTHTPTLRTFAQLNNANQRVSEPNDCRRSAATRTTAIESDLDLETTNSSVSHTTRYTSLLALCCQRERERERESVCVCVCVCNLLQIGWWQTKHTATRTVFVGNGSTKLTVPKSHDESL
jgi:hypothetical protein